MSALSRGAAATIALVLALGPTAQAEPPAKETKETKESSPEAKSDAPALKGTPDFRVAEPTATKTIDLFPEAVLGNRPVKNERRSRITLGDDGDWKVQAAQVGAMAAIFGALVGLCGTGSCMIPKAVTDPLPDFLKAKPFEVNDPRPAQDLPTLR